ncbi:hypothetical protein ACFL5V_00380 [Fibrobacterota bacterium]
MKTVKITALMGLIITVLCFMSCAPNNERYVSEAAGFWPGLWHGLICVITFIISLFSENVGIYEVNNTGGWYDFGFMLGIAICLGQGGKCCSGKKKKRSVSCNEKEWEEIGKKVEEKVRRGIQKWVEEPDKEKMDGNVEKKDWKAIGKKVEEKIKRELKNWAEK